MIPFLGAFKYKYPDDVFPIPVWTGSTFMLDEYGIRTNFNMEAKRTNNQAPSLRHLVRMSPCATWLAVHEETDNNRVYLVTQDGKDPSSKDIVVTNQADIAPWVVENHGSGNGPFPGWNSGAEWSQVISPNLRWVFYKNGDVINSGSGVFYGLIDMEQNQKYDNTADVVAIFGMDYTSRIDYKKIFSDPTISPASYNWCQSFGGTGVDRDDSVLDLIYVEKTGMAWVDNDGKRYVSGHKMVTANGTGDWSHAKFIIAYPLTISVTMGGEVDIIVPPDHSQVYTTVDLQAALAPHVDPAMVESNVYEIFDRTDSLMMDQNIAVAMYPNGVEKVTSGSSILYYRPVFLKVFRPKTMEILYQSSVQYVDTVNPYDTGLIPYGIQNANYIQMMTTDQFVLCLPDRYERGAKQQFDIVSSGKGSRYTRKSFHTGSGVYVVTTLNNYADVTNAEGGSDRFGCYIVPRLGDNQPSYSTIQNNMFKTGLYMYDSNANQMFLYTWPEDFNLVDNPMLFMVWFETRTDNRFVVNLYNVSSNYINTISATTAPAIGYLVEVNHTDRTIDIIGPPVMTMTTEE